MHFIGIQKEATLLPILELLLAAVCYTKETYCYLYCFIFAECSLKKKSGMPIELPDGQFIAYLKYNDNSYELDFVLRDVAKKEEVTVSIPLYDCIAESWQEYILSILNSDIRR